MSRVRSVATAPGGSTCPMRGGYTTPSAMRRSPSCGDGGWWPAVDRGLSEGVFDDEVVVGLADVVRSRGESVAWVTTVPSARRGDLIVKLAERVATELGIAHVPLVARTGERPPQ